MLFWIENSRLGSHSLVSLLKSLNIFLVILVLLAGINPCAALADAGGYVDYPSPGQREPKFLPGVVVGGYVLTNAEIIVALVVGTGVVGYATISDGTGGFDDVLKHFNQVNDCIFLFFEDILNGIHPDGSQRWGTHTIHVHIPGTAGFVDAQRQYTAAQAAKDSYEDSKRKGSPVPGNHRDADDFHEMPRNGNPYSSAWLFNCQADKDNGCPKQIRYFNEKGERDMDIDFSHGGGVDQCVKDGEFPHKHYWRNGVRDDRHLYEGIDEIIRNWKCKKYNFKKGTWCP
jgi:hypothetical protein